MKKSSIISLARKHLRDLTPYSTARDEFQGKAKVFLDANENPFPGTSFNRYPDPHQKALKTEIGKLKSVTPEKIFLGNGSDEVIDLLIRAVCEPGQDEIVIPQPTYGMYSVCASINNIRVIAPALTKTFDLDEESILGMITAKTKMIFLCSPNNPSGNLLERKPVEKILRSFNGLVVIDEAYIDFAGSASWTTRLDDFSNLVVLQTFSKAWGLAGLRLGMGFADKSLVELLDRIKPPYNINSYSQMTVLQAIRKKQGQKEKWIKAILAERKALTDKLKLIRGVQHIFQSDANFLLVKINNAPAVYHKLVSKGIIVRDRSAVRLCEDCLRITIGTREENKALLDALNKL